MPLLEVREIWQLKFPKFRLISRTENITLCFMKRLMIFKRNKKQICKISNSILMNKTQRVGHTFITWSRHLRCSGPRSRNVVIQITKEANFWRCVKRCIRRCAWQKTSSLCSRREKRSTSISQDYNLKKIIFNPSSKTGLDKKLLFYYFKTLHRKKINKWEKISYKEMGNFGITLGDSLSIDYQFLKHMHYEHYLYFQLRCSNYRSTAF